MAFKENHHAEELFHFVMWYCVCQNLFLSKFNMKFFNFFLNMQLNLVYILTALHAFLLSKILRILMNRIIFST